MFEARKISSLERKHQNLVSYVLGQGGVLNNGHIHFDKEIFEKNYQNHEISSSRTQQKRKWMEVREEELKDDGLRKKYKKKEILSLIAYKKCQRQKKAFHYGNEGGYYNKRVSNTSFCFEIL